MHFLPFVGSIFVKFGSQIAYIWVIYGYMGIYGYICFDMSWYDFCDM